MAQNQHLPIYKQTYDILLRTMIATRDFPREYKNRESRSQESHATPSGLCSAMNTPTGSPDEQRYLILGRTIFELGQNPPDLAP
jgi:hypothetical protein